MAGRDPTRIAETLRGVAAGTTMFRISPGQARTISAGILLAAADVADELATVIAERDRAMRACEQMGAALAEKGAEIARLRAENERLRGRVSAMTGVNYNALASGMATHTPEGLTIMSTKSFDVLAEAMFALRAGITAAVEGRYERQVSGLDDRYCQHDVLRRRDCPQCLDAHLSALLDPPPAPDGGEDR